MTFYVKMIPNLVLYIDKIKLAVNSILTSVSLLRLKKKEKKNRHIKYFLFSLMYLPAPTS